VLLQAEKAFFLHLAANKLDGVADRQRGGQHQPFFAADGFHRVVAGQRAGADGLGVPTSRPAFSPAQKRFWTPSTFKALSRGAMPHSGWSFSHSARIGIFITGVLKSGNGAQQLQRKKRVMSLACPVSSRTIFSSKSGIAYCWQHLRSSLPFRILDAAEERPPRLFDLRRRRSADRGIL